MSYIPVTLRQAVMQRAHFRCEYCLTSQFITGDLVHVEHIYPESLGGVTELHNLACACSRCNAHKGVRTRVRDPQSGMRLAIFNPRRQGWRRNFSWSSDGSRIIGLTRIGRATVGALNFNDSDVTRARLL